MNLDAWKKAMDLVTKISEVTKDFPKEETYGLISQIRRSAVSIPSNIAEGAARGSNQYFNHFLNIGLGSLSELETQLIISANLGYLHVEIKDDLLEELGSIRRLILGLKRSLQN